MHAITLNPLHPLPDYTFSIPLALSLFSLHALQTKAKVFARLLMLRLNPEDFGKMANCILISSLARQDDCEIAT